YIAKWGLCRPDRKLLVLNLTLAVLPSRLTDYVISHELAHLDVPNHSAAFFRRLEELEPDWRRLGQELQSHRHVHLG
ncbi:MAG TPA: M48 family metallopeptidase, partial [Clostridiaceae bacterium]|nr:M48 family metallopeptidase [Clostridiaceae bacterium]